MKRLFIFLLLVLATIANAKQELSDTEIRQIIIQQSIAQYPGVCACPYSITRNGSKCGGRSAYSKLGGYSPFCFPQDIPNEIVNRYKNNL